MKKLLILFLIVGSTAMGQVTRPLFVTTDGYVQANLDGPGVSNVALVVSEATVTNLITSDIDMGTGAITNVTDIIGTGNVHKASMGFGMLVKQYTPGGPYYMHVNWADFKLYYTEGSITGNRVDWGATPALYGNWDIIFGDLDVGNMKLSTAGLVVTNDFGWEDLRFPVGVAAPVTPNADVAVDEDENAIVFETGCGTNRVTDDHVWGVAQMPHTWLAESDVSLHVHFEQANADQTNLWYGFIRRHPLDGAKVTTWTGIGPATNMFTYSSGTLHQMAVFNLTDMTGMEESSIMDWKIFRDGNFGTGDINFKEFDIHYQIEKPTGQQGVGP